MKPARSLLHKEFQYVPACKTDISKTFARERRRLAEQQAKPANVRAIKAKGAK